MWFSCLKLDCRSHKQLGVISRGSGVSDSHEVNLGIVGETSVDAPLPFLLVTVDLVSHSLLKLALNRLSYICSVS